MFAISFFSLAIVVILITLFIIFHKKKCVLSYQRYKNVYDHSLHFTSLLTPSGKLIDANLSALSLTEKTMNDLYDKDFWECAWWHDNHALQEQIKKSIKKSSKDGTLERFISHHTDHSGETGILDFSIKPVRDKIGKVCYLIFEGRDITNEWKIKESLVESEQAFYDLFSNSPDPCWLIDNENNVTCNNSAVTFLGYSKKDEFKGLHPGELSPELQPDGEISVHKAHKQIAIAHAQGVHRLEWIFKRKSGQLVPVELTLASINFKNKPVIYCAGRDLSDRKNSENKNRVLIDELTISKINAEAASQAKSSFICNISHEIRTPLNSILGVVQALEPQKLTPDVLESTEIIERSGKKLLNLINDLLDLSTIESGNLKIANNHFELLSEISEIKKMFSAKFSEKNIEYTEEISPDVPQHVKGDQKRLHQILVNIISNAIKFTDHGKIILKATQESFLNECWVSFSITDSGVGIPEDKLEMIFENFTQAEEGYNRSFGGTGLGLSICNNLVSIMGGTLTVKSEQGIGSTFTFKLPFQLSKPLHTKTLNESPREKNQTDHPLTILVVDDSDDNLRIVDLFLSNTHHRYDTANGGKKALELISYKRYDLILMDIQMPEMDGIETTQRIFEEQDKKKQQRSYVVALTAHAMEEEKEKYLSAGLNDHYTKPIIKKQFLNKIQSISNEIFKEDYLRLL